ncbi:MAG: RHS repeat-associated core domain-containing protein, partial [Anaerolineae bacterium]|nr:RHS repeat-associated core domain-containing protein [Anaerolineae bacterium]
VQYRVDEGAWTDWLTGTAVTLAGFRGESGHVYHFRVRTWDRVGNAREYPAAPDATTRIRAPVTKYYYAGDRRIALRQGDVVYYIHTDHLGSTGVLSDEAGNEVPGSGVRYYPYGRTRLGDPASLPTDFGFTGQRLDAGTGLYQMGVRWYDPRIGRWISADTIVPEPGNPQG